MNFGQDGAKLGQTLVAVDEEDTTLQGVAAVARGEVTSARLAEEEPDVVVQEMAQVTMDDVEESAGVTVVSGVGETEVGVGKRKHRLGCSQVFVPGFVTNIILKPVFSSTNLEQASKSRAPISLSCPSNRSVAT